MCLSAPKTLSLQERKSCKQRGIVVVTSLILMLVLIVIGTLTIMLAVTERFISQNHKMAKDVFYVADGGHPLAVKVIEDMLLSRKSDYQNFTLEGNLKNELMNYHQDSSVLNDRLLDSPRYSPDIRGTLGSRSVHIDIDRINTTLLYGGSAEFAAGGESIGLGGRASKKVLFEISSQGFVQPGATATIVTTYRKIL
jgi:Tfp pilus assembly protein PilX